MQSLCLSRTFLKSQMIEHLQEFAKSTWHLYIFDKTEKIVLQQFGIQLGKSPPSTRIFAR
jgi:hypothetical protein